MERNLVMTEERPTLRFLIDRLQQQMEAHPELEEAIVVLEDHGHLVPMVSFQLHQYQSASGKAAVQLFILPDGPDDHAQAPGVAH